MTADISWLQATGTSHSGEGAGLPDAHEVYGSHQWYGAVRGLRFGSSSRCAKLPPGCISQGCDDDLICSGVISSIHDRPRLADSSVLEENHEVS